MHIRDEAAKLASLIPRHYPLLPPLNQPSTPPEISIFKNEGPEEDLHITVSPLEFVRN